MWLGIEDEPRNVLRSEECLEMSQLLASLQRESSTPPLKWYSFPQRQGGVARELRVSQCGLVSDHLGSLPPTAGPTPPR